MYMEIGKLDEGCELIIWHKKGICDYVYEAKNDEQAKALADELTHAAQDIRKIILQER